MVQVRIKHTPPHAINTDFEVRSLDIPTGEQDITSRGYHLLVYLFMGLIFGVILVKAEVISWFRIQEMFRLQSFHMYGIIGSAVMVGMISLALIKKIKPKTFYGEPVIAPRERKFSKGQVYGGLLFGCGWALTGACPGPLFAQIGAGSTVVVVTLCSAIAGTWLYGLVSKKLPH